MAVLVLHRSSGVTTLEPGNADTYAREHGFDLMPAVRDDDECVKLLRNGDGVASAQSVGVSLGAVPVPRSS